MTRLSTKSALLAVALLIFCGNAFAVAIVPEGSFENPQITTTNPNYNTDNVITGWIVSGNGGVWRPSGSEATAPDGLQIAYLNDQTAISQTLTLNSAADSIYTLTVAIGKRGNFTDIIPGAQFALELYNGNQLVANTGGDTRTFNAGEWQDIVLTWTAPSNVTAAALGIRIGGADDDANAVNQVLVDNVRLVVSTNGNGGQIPEPMTMGLMGSGLVGLVLLRRRIRK